jgi:hypothetical protein
MEINLLGLERTTFYCPICKRQRQGDQILYIRRQPDGRMYRTTWCNTCHQPSFPIIKDPGKTPVLDVVDDIRKGNDTRRRVEQPQTSRKGESKMSKKDAVKLSKNVAVKVAKTAAKAVKSTVKSDLKVGVTLRFYCGKCAAGVDVKVKSFSIHEGHNRAHGVCPTCKRSIGRGL